MWIAVFSYIGNYFWTHYFFKLLGAAYTMPSPKLNDVGGVPAWLPTPGAWRLAGGAAGAPSRRRRLPPALPSPPPRPPARARRCLWSCTS